MSDLGDLFKKRDYISGWLGDYQMRAEQLPYVQKSLEVTQYQIDVASNMPNDLPRPVRTDIVDSFANSVPFWESFAATGKAPTNQYNAVSGLALEASGSNVAYQAISAAAVGYTPEVTAWARAKTTDYQALLAKQNREDSVRTLIIALLPARVDEFDTAAHSFAAVIAGGHEQSIWGIHIQKKSRI